MGHIVIISSQRYINNEIVTEKIEAGDFKVSLSPEFEYDGEVYRVVIDGHHRLAAAREAGVEPEFVECNPQIDFLCLLKQGDIEGFLERTWMDSDWYDIETGANIW